MKRYVWVVLWLVGCQARDEGRSVAPTDQVTEPAFAALSASGTSGFGEPCDVGGSSACESRVCLKVDAAQRLSGSVCSQSCTTTPCPSGWMCAQVFPEGGNEFCVPEVRP